MPNVTVGSILSADTAQWQNDPRYVASGTVGAGDISAGTLYIGPSGSANASDYIGAWLITSVAMNGSPFYNNKVTAYDPATKRVTAPSLSNAGYPSSNGVNWWITRDYPMQRQFQWNRNGTPIPNAVNTMYTLQQADIGSDVTVTETSGWISNTDSNIGYNTYEVPAATTSSTSAPVTVTGTISSKLVSQDNISYLGSFKLPASVPATPRLVRAISVMPAAYAQNNQQSLVFNSQGNGPEFTEIAIPALSSSNSFASLTPATVTRTLSDAYGGKWSNVGIENGGAGLTDPHGFYFDTGAGKSLLGLSGFYTRQVFGAIFQRNTSTASTGTVDGPVSIIDSVNGQTISRCHAGSITKIPAEWQTAMGGDLIFGTGLLAIVGAASDGPAAISVNSADITAAMPNVESGAARGGSATTIQLSASCVGSTTDFYKNWWIFVPSCSATGGEPKGRAVRVLSFEASTKTATIDTNSVPGFAFSPTPGSGASYTLYPYVNGRQLIRYSNGQLDPNADQLNRRGRVWNAGTFSSGMFWPNGTDSLVVVGHGGGDVYQYGISGQPNQQNLSYPPSVIFSAQEVSAASPTGPGPNSSWHCDGTGVRFWSYSAQDFQSVISGSKTYSNIRPHACWSIRLPTYSTWKGLDASGISAACYDQTTRRLYICMSVRGEPQSGGVGPANLGHAVHVYEVTNAIAVP